MFYEVWDFGGLLSTNVSLNLFPYCTENRTRPCMFVTWPGIWQHSSVLCWRPRSCTGLLLSCVSTVASQSIWFMKNEKLVRETQKEATHSLKTSDLDEKNILSAATMKNKQNSFLSCDCRLFIIQMFFEVSRKPSAVSYFWKHLWLLFWRPYE